MTSKKKKKTCVEILAKSRESLSKCKKAYTKRGHIISNLKKKVKKKVRPPSKTISKTVRLVRPASKTIKGGLRLIPRPKKKVKKKVRPASKTISKTVRLVRPPSKTIRGGLILKPRPKKVVKKKKVKPKSMTATEFKKNIRERIKNATTEKEIDKIINPLNDDMDKLVSKISGLKINQIGHLIMFGEKRIDLIQKQIEKEKKKKRKTKLKSMNKAQKRLFMIKELTNRIKNMKDIEIKKETLKHMMFSEFDKFNNSKKNEGKKWDSKMSIAYVVAKKLKIW
jgi:hypothetical protein